VTHRLQGRVAVVTGAARGIGRAIAGRLADEGATVVVNDLDPEACERVAAELPAGAAAAGDVTDPAAADAVVSLAGERFGALDILVNNAAVTRDAPVHRMADADWRVVQDVGLWGTFCMCRAAHRLLCPREDAPGHHRKVVNMSSSVALYGAAGTTNYAAAKAGVVGFTKSLAREWARHRVNVNAVAPGVIEGTGMTDAKPAELIGKVVAQVPLGRAGTPGDVAGAVAFLCSADADYMTGQVLELHGGMEVLG
jgi:NAD(P)-dependent dehydrogenase (short-subunit alcohol dehydrogenase family)